MSKIGKLRKWTTQVIIGALVMFILVAALWWIFIPAFRQSSQGRGTLGASLCSRKLRIQRLGSNSRETGSHCCDSNASVHTTAPLNENLVQ